MAEVSLSGSPVPRGQFASRARNWRSVLRRYSLDIWLPLGFIVVLAAACFLWPLVYPVPNPVGGNILNANLSPLSPGHLLGTDNIGNDVLSRILYGGRISLEVGLAANLIGLVIGGVIGGFAGYLGGVFDTVAMRAIDILLAFPSLVLLLIVSEYLGPSELHVIWAISFFTVPSFARLARSYTLRVREEVYVSAARVCGSRSIRTFVGHIAPNIGPQLMTFGILGVGGAITFEAALSYLGLGVPPPAPSWGNMISTAELQVQIDPIQVIIPCVFLCVTILAFNLLGDALRARWNVER